MKNNNCFYCLHHDELNSIIAENNGWYHHCKLNIQNEDLQDIKSCEGYKPNNGFQIGGYYTHMHFEPDGDCLEWIIHSDGDFPRNDPSDWIRFHICDFEQIVKWVDFWKNELKKSKRQPCDRDCKNCDNLTC